MAPITPSEPVNEEKYGSEYGHDEENDVRLLHLAPTRHSRNQACDDASAYAEEQGGPEQHQYDIEGGLPKVVHAGQFKADQNSDIGCRNYPERENDSYEFQLPNSYLRNTNLAEIVSFPLEIFKK
jgi:hypothetical protein